MNLNEEQKKVVDAVYNAGCRGGRYIQVNAGPGTGKTATLVSTISNLLRKGVDKNDILAVTFTKKAAREMNDRIMKDVNTKCNCSTIHSYLYQTYFKPGGWTILDDRHKNSLISYIISSKCEDDGKEYNKNKITKLVRLYTKPNERIDDEELMSYFVDIKEFVDDKFRSMKKTYDYVTFDDIIYICASESHTPSQRFKYIFVDEYQDINDNTNKAIEKMLSEDGVMTVFGDTAQSLYGFNGANPQIMANFEKRHLESCEVINLKYNYRSDQKIIDCYGAMLNKYDENDKISEWSSRTLKSSSDDRNGEKPVLITSQLGGMSEQVIKYTADDVCKRIAGLLNDGVPSSEIAVLFRSIMIRKGKTAEQEIYKQIKASLQNDKISYSVSESKAYTDSESLILSAISCAMRKKQMPLEKLEVLTGLAKFNSKEQKEIENFVFRNSYHFDETKRKINGAIDKYNEIIESISKIDEKIDINLQIDLLKDIILNYFKDLQCVDECISSMKNIANDENIKTLTDILDATEKGSPAIDVNSEKVNLMTIHKSKGLEFQYVFYVDATAHGKEKYDDLCASYVAMSRAKRGLYVYSLRRADKAKYPPYNQYSYKSYNYIMNVADKFDVENVEFANVEF